MFIRIGVTTRLVCIAATLLARVSAQTGAWTPPIVLSAGGQGWEAAAAIDADGNSVALWDERTTQDQLWSRSRPSNGSWGPPAEFAPALQTVSVFPAVRISAAGFATAVWSDQGGVWTADRPSGSNWRSSQLLIPGASSPIFAMNSLGDAAVVWTVGGGPRNTSGSVMVVQRPAGGTWTAQRIVTSGVHVIADQAGIGADGAVIVVWETYNATCSKYGCVLNGYALHASRQNPGTNSWVDSGSLLGPDRASHQARVALDSIGEAVVVAMNSAGNFAAATQGSSGGAWNAFKTVVVNPQALTPFDLESDDAGQVSLVYEFISYPSSRALAVSGSVGTNTWSSPVALSGSDASVSQVHFALAPGGAALAVWLQNSATPVIHAAIRTTATGAWGNPVTVSGPGSYIAPEAVAANSSGDAIVIYSGYDAASVHTEYATNYHP
jgi:hypothetical protein